MTDGRPDTHERDEPAGTSSPGPGDLTATPATPGVDDAGPTAVPGAYEADQSAQERGKAVRPGN